MNKAAFLFKFLKVTEQPGANTRLFRLYQPLKPDYS